MTTFVQDIAFRIISRTLWTAKNFRKGFEHLQVPVTTATERQITGWQAEDVWPGYWASIQDFCERNQPAQELISIIMNPELLKVSTREHRLQIELWVEKYIPGYRAIWEEQIIPELNRILAAGGKPQVAGFQFGKDGRGALPDKYFQCLLEHKMLTVGNHHDILGHFLLFTDKQVRESTEIVVSSSMKVHRLTEHLELYHNHMRVGNAQVATERRTFRDRFLEDLRPLNALITFSWNLAQEKLYFSGNDANGSYFSLLGAFNTVYNTTFSSKLSVDHLDSTVAGLGMFNEDFRRTIVMTPEIMSRYLTCRPFADQPAIVLKLRAELQNRIDEYAIALAECGLSDPRYDEIKRLSDEFITIVRESMYAKWGPFRLSVRNRWKKYAGLIQDHPTFSRIFTLESMLKIAVAQSRVSEAAAILHKECFEVLAERAEEARNQHHASLPIQA